MRFKFITTVLALCALLCLVVAGCGSSGGGTSSETGSSTETTSEGGGEGTSSVVADAKAATKKNLTGTDRALPSSGPETEAGKKVFLIPCSAAAPGCQIQIVAAEEAGKKAGWDMTEIDGKGTPTGFQSAIESAIAAGAEGIIMASIDCQDAKRPLEEAKAKGIEVLSMAGTDCNEPGGGGGPGLFDAYLDYGPYKNFAGLTKEAEKAVAQYIIAETNGEAKIVLPVETDLLATKHYAESFKEAIAECESCELYEVPFTLADLTENGLESKLSAALTAHPETNVLAGPYDAALELGITAAVEQARAGGEEIMITGLEGLPATIELMHEGKVQMVPGAGPLEWWGWASIDELNRAFAGEPMVDAGMGLQSITEEQNLPPKGQGYDGNQKSQGYKENYEKIWGVS